MPSEMPKPPYGEHWIDLLVDDRAVLMQTDIQAEAITNARAELSTLREQVKRLEKFVDHQDLHSDFRNASEMRAEIERLRGRVIQAHNAALDEAAAAARRIWDHYEFLCAANILDGGGTDEFKEHKAKSEAAKKIETAIIALKGS